jgi:hypothetical protein
MPTKVLYICCYFCVGSIVLLTRQKVQKLYYSILYNTILCLFILNDCFTRQQYCILVTEFLNFYSVEYRTFVVFQPHYLQNGKCGTRVENFTANQLKNTQCNGPYIFNVLLNNKSNQMSTNVQIEYTDFFLHFRFRVELISIPTEYYNLRKHFKVLFEVKHLFYFIHQTEFL